MRRWTICLSVLLVSGVLPCLAQLPEQTDTGNKPAGKVIHDPAEYNAYIKALNTPDPAQKAKAMEAFVAEYPNSVMQEDALEQALAAYQQAAKLDEVERIARRLLELNPNHVRALAILVALTRNKLMLGPKDAQIQIASLHTWANRGLQAIEYWEIPAGMSPDDFEKLQKQMKAIFYGGAASAALQQKNYSVASHNYSKALAIEPDDLRNTYQLGIAYLEMANIDVRGFWYAARAIHMAEAQHNAATINAIKPYPQSKYRKYHGSLDGWDKVLSQAAEATVPPLDFTVDRAPEASLTSDSSVVGVSVLPSSGALAGPMNSVGSRAPASILSAASPGTGHTVAASVLSSNSIGAGHEMRASVTASTTDPSTHLVRFGTARRALVPVPIFSQR